MKWTAWAIDTRSNGFLGVWFITPGLRLAPCQEGNTTALFKTRQQARDWLESEHKKAYHPYPKMRVVKVEIGISIIWPPFVPVIIPSYDLKPTPTPPMRYV